MQTLHEFTGILNHGFVGNICYNLTLPTNYKMLKIILSYDKLLFNEINPSTRETIEKTHLSHYGTPLNESDSQTIVSSMKTEIQLAAFLGETFVGNIHNPTSRKEIFTSPTLASNGCFCTESITGVLKVVVNVFSVLEDNTAYTLTIEGEPYETL